MFYAIDYDSRKPESKNENDNLLQKYIVNNKLELAVALVSSEEELVLKFSLNELQDLYYNLNGTGRVTTENEAAEKCWSQLQTAKIPKFTKKLGDSIIKRYAPKTIKTKTNLKTVFKRIISK